MARIMVVLGLIVVLLKGVFHCYASAQFERTSRVVSFTLKHDSSRTEPHVSTVEYP